MNRRVAVLAFTVAVVLLPAGVFGQRWGRYGNTPPMSPYGPLYDPTTWRQAGYNPIVYQQLMEQKMIMAQQKAMLKQQQMLQKMQQQNAKNKNGNSTNNNQLNFMPGAGNPTQPFLGQPRAARKKRHIRKTPATASTATAKKKDAAKNSKPADAAPADSSGTATNAPADAGKDPSGPSAKAKPDQPASGKTP